MKVGLVLGLDGAGKTLLLRHLSRICKQEHNPKFGSVYEKIRSRIFTDGKQDEDIEEIDMTTVPTTGVEEEILSYRNISVTLREVGAPMLSMWKSYFSTCDFFIFVVDLSNFSQLPAAAMEFFNVMQSPAMQKKVGFLLFNKLDAPSLVPTQWLRSLFCLDTLSTTSNVFVVKVSASRGDHLDTVLQSMAVRLAPARYSHRLSQLRGETGQNKVYPTTNA